jgi:hypothetical protein
MTQANPYHAYSTGQDPVQIMRETSRKLRELADALGAQGLERSLAPGKWPARSILSHLADCEIAYGFRIRQIVAIDDPLLEVFDQDAWAKPYPTFSGQQALEVFTLLRGWNMALLKTLQPQDLERRAHHPQRGQLTLRTLLETIAGHDIHHLQQLIKIRGLDTNESSPSQ